MILYANGQDIKNIIFANLGAESPLESIKVYQTGPEGYLKALVSFLDQNKSDIKLIKKAFVVIGPGSATALRVSLSIFNTIKFATGMELIEVKKEASEPDCDVVSRIIEQGLSSFDSISMLKPIYEHDPRITMSTKDILRRKM
jgi:hypothetical protein